MRTEIYLNNVLIDDPLNLQELIIDLNFDKGNAEQSVSLNKWKFGVGRDNSTDGAKSTNKHISDGLNNGVGVFEAMPFKVKLSNGNESFDLFDGGIDLSTALVSCNEITATAIDSGNLDWLYQNADSFNVRDLEISGFIPESDVIKIPYVISTIPNNREAMIVFLSIFVFTSTLKNNIQTLIEHFTGGFNIFQVVDWVKAGLRLVYIITLIVTIIKMLIKLFNLIIQPIKYTSAMRVLTMCERSCRYLGMSFQSSILQGDYKDLVIISKRSKQIINNDKDGVLGILKSDFPQFGSVDMTFGNLIRQLMVMFNAKPFIENGVFRLERVDYNTSNDNYHLPNVILDNHTFNQDELFSNYSVEFQTDLNDKNTINEYDGVSVGVRTSPIITTNKLLSLNKGFKNNSITFARASVKTDLTIYEKSINLFPSLINKIIGVADKIQKKLVILLNKITSLINKIIKKLKTIGIKIKITLAPIKPFSINVKPTKIENRIGMLQMENDFIVVPKMFTISQGNQPINTKPKSNDKQLVNANYIYDNYHIIQSFDKSQFQKTNQHKKYSVENFPFCFEDYKKVRKSNKLTTFDGRQGEIISLKFNPIKQNADIDFKLNEIYSNNFKTTKIIADGT